LNRRSYIAPSASIHHENFHIENNVFIGDRTVIYQARDGGLVEIGKGTHIHSDVIIETGFGGSLTIGADTHIQPRCQFTAYVGSIEIGSGVQIAPNCSFYPYNHSFAPGELIKNQPLKTKGGIVLEDDVWLGVGVIVLDGVRIGKGAAAGAGSVVTQDIPEETIAVGIPARVVKRRADLL
jgi:acetyltransferase-like isoleucine patch superfamily enzyme